MATKKEAVLDIPKVKVKRFKVRIVGDSPVIVHAWSEKAKKEMLENQTGPKPKTPKEPRNPAGEFINSMYWLSGRPEELTMPAFEKAVKKGAKFGMPVSMFIKAAANGARHNGAAKFKNEVFSKMWISGDAGEMATIKSDPPICREDMVKIGAQTKVSYLRYRGEFRNWSVELNISYNANISSIEEIISFLNLGGFSAGVGEWRIDKGGIFGAYHCEI
jgi:hypothetical protein